MLKFELKKIFKKNYFIFITIFALLTSAFALINNQSNGNPTFPSAIEINENGVYEISTFSNYIDLHSKDNDHLSEEDKAKIGAEIDEIYNYTWSAYILDGPRNEDKVDKTKYKTEYIRQVESFDKLLNKYNIKIKNNKESQWEWVKFASNNMKTSSASPMSYEEGGKYFPNLTKNLVHNQKILFAFPLILFVIILFHNIISEEREKGTYNLLKTNGLNDFAIFKNKFFLFILTLIIYFSLVSVFMLIGSIIVGQGGGLGFSDIYKVFDSKDLSYIKGYRLLISLFLSYLALFTLISSFVLFISSKVNNSRKAFGILLSIFCLLVFVNMYNTYSFSSYNPINLFDYKMTLTGGIVEVLAEDGNTLIQKISLAKGILPYIICLAISVLFFILALVKVDIFGKEKTKIQKHPKKLSLLDFENLKIYKSPDFYLYICLAFVVLAALFFRLKFEDDKLRDEYLSEANNSSIEDFIEKEEKAMQDFIKNKDLIISESINIIDKPMELSFEEYYEIRLEAYKDEIKKLKDEKEDSIKLKEYYISQNGGEYYKLKEKIYQNDFGNYSPRDKANLSYSKASYYEGLARLEKLAEINHKPLLKNWIVYQSKLEEGPLNAKALTYENLHYENSHSSIYSLYRIFNIYKLDIIMIIFLVLVCAGGFTNDKEDGNQIKLLFSQPIKRKDIIKNKLIASLSTSLAILVMLVFFIILLGFITEGFGNINYPVIYYKNSVKNIELISQDKLSYFSLMPIYLYLIRLFVIIIFQIIFLISLAIFISIFVRRKIDVFVILTSILTLGIYSSKYLPYQLNYSNPFSHLIARNIADGSIIFKASFGFYSIFISILVLLIWSFILTYISVKLSKSKEIKWGEMWT